MSISKRFFVAVFMVGSLSLSVSELSAMDGEQGDMSASMVSNFGERAHGPEVAAEQADVEAKAGEQEQVRNIDVEPYRQELKKLTEEGVLLGKVLNQLTRSVGGAQNRANGANAEYAIMKCFDEQKELIVGKLFFTQSEAQAYRKTLDGARQMLNETRKRAVEQAYAWGRSDLADRLVGKSVWTLEENLIVVALVSGMAIGAVTMMIVGAGR